MSTLDLNPMEKAKHLKAIQRLAGEIGRDVALVKDTYEHELERLQDGARVRDYLPLLTARHTMEILRNIPETRGSAN
ncbi:MAG: DUF3562 domain-containing protein [Prolixibacteraceae bacterium]|nr:DUF3562 domain-containing protein [Burkholderiales bacterium]